MAAYALAVVAEPAGEFEITLHLDDGAAVSRGDVLATVTANARALLTAERVALNLLTLMSGTATATAAWVRALAGTGTRVRDSRKTVPGLRMLQKYAVRVAGGVNHRMCLADAALIKDNHVIAAGGVVPAYQAVRAAFPDLPVQVEVTSHEQAREVVAAGRRRHSAGQYESRYRWRRSLPSSRRGRPLKRAVDFVWITQPRLRRPGWITLPWEKSPIPRESSILLSI